MRAAPEGTVPRERITLNPRLTAGREPDGPMQPNAEPLPNYVATVPLPISRKLLELGRKRFDITCATCHGPLADGKSIVATQMSLRPPPSLQDPKFVAKPAGYIYEVITKGFGMMASYAAELSVEERWSVVAYLRALQLSQNTPVSALPPEIRQQLEALPPNMDAPAPAAPPAPARKRRNGERRNVTRRGRLTRSKTLALKPFTGGGRWIFAGGGLGSGVLDPHVHRDGDEPQGRLASRI